MRHYLLIALLMLTGSFAFAQGPEVVIPRPSEVTLSEGFYTFAQEPSIKVSYVKGKYGPEEYLLSVTKRGVKIKVSSAAGEYYALQTLDQMTQQGAIKQIQCCEIKDAPRFSYRGLHVDVSRHFRSLDFLKKQIDAMAMFKMARLYFHTSRHRGRVLYISRAHRDVHAFKSEILRYLYIPRAFLNAKSAVFSLGEIHRYLGVKIK